MTDREEAFRIFLMRTGTIGIIWGVCDCLLEPCDWVRERTGLDPAREFRGRYSTMIESQRMLRRAGGLFPVARAAMGASGLPETVEPKRGDVGIVAIEMQMARSGKIKAVPVGAVHTGHHWRVKTDQGSALLRVDPVVAWAVP